MSGVVLGKILIMNEGIDFKIEAETADIHIAAADAHDVTVAGHGFGVEKAVIKVNLDPILGGLGGVGQAGPMHQVVVAEGGQHEFHIHTRAGRDTQGVHKAVVGYEVWALDEGFLHRIVNHDHEAAFDGRLLLGVRP